MDELEWNWVYFGYMDAPEKQRESAERAGYIKVYAKKKVDAIIAQKDLKIAELQKDVEYWKRQYEDKPDHWQG